MEDGHESVDTVLIVDQDADVRAALREIALAAQNFRVIEAQDGPMALSVFLRAQPDLVILALELPGLSGRDMLVALKAQGYRGPLIVIVERGSSHSPVEALRLGAMDFIIKPLREAEVLAAVERCMASTRLRRQRDSLVKQLKASNQELEARMKQLTALYEVGEGVTAMKGVESLSRQILEHAVILTEADYALLLLRDETSGELVLSAGHNLPISIADRQGERAADELAKRVMTTRETLVADVDTLRQFNTEKGLYAAIYAPLVVQTASFGVLVVGNHQRRVSFASSHEQLIQGLANYLSMVIVSARLSKLLEKRSNTMKAAYSELRERDAQRIQQLRAVLASVQRPLVAIETELIRVSRQLANGRNPHETSQELIILSKQVRQMIAYITALAQYSNQTPTRPDAVHNKPIPPEQAIATEE